MLKKIDAKKSMSLAMIILLITGLAFPLEELLAQPSQISQEEKDRTKVALETLKQVIEGLKKVREFLSTRDIPSEVLSVLDSAIKNLESVTQILKSTGDLKATEAALKDSSKTQEVLSKKAIREEEKEAERDAMQRAIQRALERADELNEEVSKIENSTLRVKLSKDVEKAKDLLNQASDFLSKGEVNEAAKVLGNARDILGKVNSELNKEKAQEKLANIKKSLKEKITEKISDKISELRKDLAELQDKLLERIAKSPLKKLNEMLQRLEEANKLLDEAEKALKNQEIDAAFSTIGKVEALIKEVKDNLNKIEKFFEKSDEKMMKIINKIEELKKKLQDKALSEEVIAEANKLLDNILSLVEEAQKALEKGEIEEANSILNKAEALINQVEKLISKEKKEKGEIAFNNYQAELEIKGKKIKIEIENEGEEALTILSIKILDKEGKEVIVEWKKDCRITLEKGEELKCEGTGNFKKGQSYQALIDVRKADGSTFQIQLNTHVEESEEEQSKSEEQEEEKPEAEEEEEEEE
ncbi:MAG: hypothetical protein QXX95_03940 [Nitrososphaerales archaeon]